MMTLQAYTDGRAQAPGLAPSCAGDVRALCWRVSLHIAGASVEFTDADVMLLAQIVAALCAEAKEWLADPAAPRMRRAHAHWRLTYARALHEVKLAIVACRVAGRQSNRHRTVRPPLGERIDDDT